MDCGLAGSIETLARVAERALARALSLRARPTTPELQSLYAAWAGKELEEVEDLYCLPWALEVVESLPGVEKTEDKQFEILWASDAVAVRNRVDDLQRALEIEMCRHPGDLKLAAT